MKINAIDTATTNTTTTIIIPSSRSSSSAVGCSICLLNIRNATTSVITMLLLWPRELFLYKIVTQALLSNIIFINSFHFASAVVAVDSSHMTASSSASCSSFSLPSNFVSGHVSTMWFMVCRWPQSQEGDWARPHLCRFAVARHGPCLACPETVKQRPRVTRGIETWLSDSRVGYNSVVDHRSRRPVRSPLRICVDRYHV